LPTSPVTAQASTITGEAPPATVTTRPAASRRVPPAVLTLGLGLLIGLGVLFAWRRTHSNEDAGWASGKVLAVLPFENQGAAQDEYFADGVTDAVRGKLAAVPGVQVIAGGSSAPYKKTNKPPEQVARELGAQYLLTGTVRWDKGAGGVSRVLVSPELVEVAVGRIPQTRWQQPFDAAFQDVFQLQADIAGRVAQALDVAIGGAERQALATKPTGDSAAYDYFLRGNVYFERGLAEPDLRAAEGFYQKAVALDSTFALAYAQISLTHDQLYWFYYDHTPERLAKQKAAAERAVRLRPDLAEGHLALGFYYYHALLDYDRALDEFEAARKRQPSNGKVYFGMGAVHRRQDKWPEALADIKKSVELNPRSVVDLTELAGTFMTLRTYAEAEPYLTRAIEVSPDLQAYFYKSLLYVLWRSDTISAAKVVREAIDKLGAGPVIRRFTAGTLIHNNSWLRDELLDSASAHLPREAFGSDTARYHYWHAQVASYQGRPEIARLFLDSARVILEAQAAGQPDDPGFHRVLGQIYAELGRGDDARREAERAVALRPRSKDALANTGARTDLARTLAKIGDVDAAIDQLAYLLSVPSNVSVPLLRVDHTWDPLRGNPRFERLLATK
ncbi:MAG TPA: tetratricopeptide repeat protein, partial [Gemmatimonadales bacterium]|nr:tetratricopeptide repeat protein [Gemmatimonadales bacterium]